MLTTNRTLCKESNACTSTPIYGFLIKGSIYSLLFLTSAWLSAQENTVDFSTEDSPTLSYVSPFKTAATPYKEVFYEEGMPAKLEEKTNLILEDIFFGYNDSDIQGSAQRVLDDLVRILRENPDLAIELSAHTDSRGTVRYNERLSRNRARNMVKYLTKRGISASRLLPIGSGEGKPRNHCEDGIPCTEAEHRENRRIEMRTARIIRPLPLRNYIYKGGK